MIADLFGQEVASELICPSFTEKPDTK